jgi:hypothetical protein
MLDLVLQKEGGAWWGSNYAMSTEHGEPRSCRMKNIARRMFTGQRERDVSVGIDSKTMLWDLLGPILARDFQKIKLRIWILSLCICIPFIYSHAHGRSRIHFFLSYPLYRLSGYFDFFNPMSDTLIKLWCWLGVKSNHRINHWMNLFYSWEKLSVFATWSSGRESLCSTTIGRNYCVVSLSSFSLAEAQSKHLMDLFQFSIVLSDFITTICLNFEGHKRYLVLSSLLCPITIRPSTICHIFVSWQNSFSLKGHSILLLFTRKSDNH